MRPNRYNLPIVAALALTAMSALPSRAAEEITRQTVSYADLDLRSTAGARTLGLRLRAAADRVCGDPGAGPTSRAKGEDPCRQEALEQARRVLEERAPWIDPVAWSVAKR